MVNKKKVMGTLKCVKNKDLCNKRKTLKSVKGL